MLQQLHGADVPKTHNGQLSIADFHVPFGGTLDPDNRWVVYSSLMPWEELEDTYAPQFDPTTGAPAKPVPPLPGKLTPLYLDHFSPGGLMEQSDASLQRGRQS